MGWNCYDDDPTPDDQRCNSREMKMLVRDPADPERFLDRVKLAARLGKPEVRAKLRRTICKLPCEWDRNSITKRYGWIREQMDNPDDWARFERHLLATTFDDLPQAYLEAQWHFHPHEFIAHFRQCGWLSEDEIVRVTRKSILDKNGRENEKMTATEVKNRLHIASDKRPANLHVALQIMMRKYGIIQPHRIAHLFGQLAAETGRLEFMVERGDDAYFDKYEPNTEQGRKLGNTQLGDGKRFKGRGIIQITGRWNYTNYSKFKEMAFLTDDAAASLATDAHLTCDASGFFWSWKQRYAIDKDKKLTPNGKQGINYWADQGTNKAVALQVTKCINTQGVHFDEIRWPCFEHAWHALNDIATPPMNFKSLHEIK